MTANDSKTVAAPVKVKGVQVHATIDRALFDKLEDHRWSARLDMVQLVKVALTEYAERNGLLTEATDADPKGAPAKA